MTKLSYEYTSKSGEVKVFTSYNKLMDEINHHGGTYKSIYEPAAEKYVYKGKRERVKL